MVRPDALICEFPFQGLLAIVPLGLTQTTALGFDKEKFSLSLIYLKYISHLIHGDREPQGSVVSQRFPVPRIWLESSLFLVASLGSQFSFLLDFYVGLGSPLLSVFYSACDGLIFHLLSLSGVVSLMH